MKLIATVRVPATSANLGPGFDAMGLALDLWNSFELYADPAVDSIVVDTIGEGAGIHPSGNRHLVANILLDECPQARQLRIVCRNLVPSGSGMGSSSTATLAGVLLAACLRAGADGQPDARALQAALARAIAIEGHGDNVAPALLGGLVLVAGDGPCLVTRQVPIAPLTVAICVPDVNFLTEHARAALPAVYSRADAVFNIARGALVVEALRTGDLALLGQVMDDRIHEPYRLPSIPGAAQARAAARAAGAAAVCLSGAGPGMIAFASQGQHEIGDAMRAAFEQAGVAARVWVLPVSTAGASIAV